jgi:hypothetical protein
VFVLGLLLTQPALLFRGAGLQLTDSSLSQIQTLFSQGLLFLAVSRQILVSLGFRCGLIKRRGRLLDLSAKRPDSFNFLSSRISQLHALEERTLALNIPAEPGERAERRAVPLYGPNVSILYTMIPKGDDPCDPGRRFALMFVDGATGQAIKGTGSTGVVVGSPSPLPEPQVTREGEISLSGAPLPPEVLQALNEKIKDAAPFMPWHRGAWKELLDLQ